MKRVLFVDDEPNILDGLKVMLHSVRDQWEMHFATSGPEGLETIKGLDEPLHVVVSDLNMPGMQGDEFLAEVRDVSPETVRFVLSGRLDTPNLARAGAVAHQILGKPCDPHALRALLTRALGLRNRLTECTKRGDLFKLCGIPSVPLVYWDLQNELSQSDPSIERVASIIERDPSMSAKVLQVSHAARGAGNTITSISQAVRSIGVDNIRSFVLMAGMFEVADPATLPEGIDLEVLWQHAMQVGDFSRRIAEAETEDQASIDAAYSAGLLHDIGLLIIATKMTDAFGEAIRLRNNEHYSIYKAEKEVFGTTHAEIGGFLLDLWGLPDHIVESIAYHLYPSSVPDANYDFMLPGEESFSPLTAVHVANYLCEDQDSMIEESAKAELDSVYLEMNELTARLEDWYEVCFEA